METLQEFLTHTKGISYLLAAVIMTAFIPLWLFVTDREEE